MVGLKGGDRDAIWAGTGWMGLRNPLRLPLCWVAVPGMALVGWMERWLGSRSRTWPRFGPWLVLDGTLLVPVVVSGEVESC
jgi:hypothetical protein